jgi:GH24 family phage-related lysozyme (muramidase)
VKKFLILGALAAGALVLARRASANVAPPAIATDGTAGDIASREPGLFDQVLDLGYQVQASVSSSARMMSSSGLDTLKRAEGFRSVVYNDVAGYPTIGYGHKLLPGEDLSSIGDQDATVLLAHDVTGAENAVNALVTADIQQYQFDALVSFVYNVGTAAFRSSTLLKKVNAQDPDALNEFARWRYVTVNGVKQVSTGLVNRRAIEAQMWQGFYS